MVFASAGLSCPNKTHPDWIDLVERIGEKQAYVQFVENDFNIPPSWRNVDESALNESINTFLSTIGVTTKQVSEIVNRGGEVIGATAMADLVYKTIQVVEGKAKIDTLPEEASHFLVAMLRGSTLYNSMFSDIAKLEMYKDVVAEYNDQYKGNQTKLKEEAMAKVIASIIVGNFEDTKMQPRVNSWFNKVLQYIKEIFNRGNKDDLYRSIAGNSPFSEAADMIINNRINEKYYPSLNDEEFYQLDNQDQNTIVEALENNLGRGSLSLEGDKYILTKPDGTKVEIKNRVSDRVAKNFTNTRELTPQEQASLNIRSSYGTKGHADIENIIKRIVSTMEGKIAPAKTENLGPEMYRTLENYFRKFVASFPEGTKFLPELMVYDEKADEGGTSDLPVVLPNGDVDIYDWKFQEFKGKKDENKEIAAWKRKNYNTQLGRYREMFKKTYGVKNIRRTRVIPIEANYKNNKLESIKIGPNEISSFGSNNSYLKPVPISSELTGDERLDKLIEDLLRQKEEIINMKPSNIKDEAKRESFKEQRKQRIKEIDLAIQDIQLTNDIEGYIKRAIREVKDIYDTGVENLSEEELSEAHKRISFYGQRLIQTLGDRVKDKEKSYNQDLKNLITNAQILEGELNNEYVKRTTNQFGENINKPIPAVGWWERNLRTLSQQSHPVMQALYKLISKAKENTAKALVTLRERIEETQNALEKYQREKGISNENMFDFMLDKTGRTLRLIATYSSDYYKQRNEQRDLLKNGSKEEQKKALAWFEENTTFDEERFKKAREEYKKNSQKFYRNWDKPAEAIKHAMRQFDEKYGSNSTGYRNSNNFYVRPKEIFYSEQYKNIQANKPLKDFYDLFVEQTKEYRNIIGQSHDARFVWNVKKDFIDSVAENGLFSTNPLNFLNDAVRLQAGLRDGNVDPSTGETDKSIPTYYVEGVEAARQSTDLGRVLYMAGAMANNYKNMAEIEDSAKGLEVILKQSEEILTDANGEPIINKLTDRVQKIIGSATTLEQYKDYMNYYIYGIKNKTKDYKVSILGKEVSGLAVYNFINKYFVGKTLAGNPVSIVANSVGGDWNARILGAGKRFYSNKDYNKALGDLGIRDKKAYAVVGYLDLLDRENTLGKANDLSVNNLTKYMTYENLFIGQKAGDYAIRNSTGLAMMRGYTLKDGKITRKTEDSQQSIYDMLSVENEKLEGLDKIPEAELEKFRTKMLKVTEDILGNNSRDDIRLAQLTIMGRALMTFRSWIPRTIDSRYGELRYSDDIEAYELGRYRSFWNQIVNKQFLPLIAETLVNFGSFGYAKFGNATIEKAKELYREAILKNPELNLTEQEYIDIHIANLKANIMEMYILGSAFAILLAVKPSPDDDKDDVGAFRQYVSKQMTRNLSELLFYYNPNEFNTILKSPIPITRVLSDINNLLIHSVKEGVGVATGDDKMQYDARPMKYGLKIFPLLNGIENALSIVDEDYDRTKERTFTSKQ